MSVHVRVCVCDRVTVLNKFLTVGHGLSALEATCPGGNSGELQSCVVKRQLPTASVSGASEVALLAAGKLAPATHTPNSLPGG